MRAGRFGAVGLVVPWLSGSGRVVAGRMVVLRPPVG